MLVLALRHNALHNWPIMMPSDTSVMLCACPACYHPPFNKGPRFPSVATFRDAFHGMHEQG